MIAFSLGQTVIGAVALQGSLTQQFAALALGETARVNIIFQIRLSETGLGSVLGFQQSAGFFKVVIAVCGATGSGDHLQLELLDDRLFGNHAAVLSIWRRAFNPGEY
ncbi:hypothetical protein D3C87_1107440 [compost metagenome]